MKYEKLIIEWIIKTIEERKSNQKLHRFFFPNCKKCRERNLFLIKLKESLTKDNKGIKNE